MKKIKFIAACYIAISFSISSCTSLEPNAFVIYGTTDHADGSSVYRIISGPNGQPLTIDSTKVVNGSFELKGTLDQIDINFIFLEGVNGNVPVILEEGSIEMEIFKDSLASSITAGTPSNNNLAQYRESTQGFAKDMRTLVQEINEANTLGDNILAEDLTLKYKAVETNLNAYEKDFMSSNPQSYVATLILERLVITKAIRSSEAKLIFNGFDLKIKSSVSGKKVEAIINVPSNPTAIGEVAPVFEGPTPTGELASLASLKGKVTIIDFWASWCRPCRIENPNLVRLYKRMHDKGLEIVGVSLDKNKSSWVRAIEDDGLSWNHVSNLKYWQEPIALMYGVRSIPAAFVLNKDGVIVAKNLRGTKLDAKIEELLSK